MPSASVRSCVERRGAVLRELRRSEPPAHQAARLLLPNSPELPPPWLPTRKAPTVLSGGNVGKGDSLVFRLLELCEKKRHFDAAACAPDKRAGSKCASNERRTQRRRPHAHRAAAWPANI